MPDASMVLIEKCALNNHGIAVPLNEIASLNVVCAETAFVCLLLGIFTALSGFAG